jgi:hypothetical protein
MEYQNEYASKGVAGAGLGLGIAGTALGVMNGGLGNILGGFGYNRNMVCAEDHVVNRYEAGQSARIAELETEVKLRDANTYTDQKLLEVYGFVNRKFDCIEHEIAEQHTYNAVNTSVLNCVKGDVEALMNLTKVIIPASSICPPVMPQYNSWVAPTTTTTG